MSGKFFDSDPLPSDWHDPDPLPSDWHDPDPLPSDWHDPDPLPSDWHDPDPLPSDWHDPDPLPSDWHDPDPLPSDWHDPDPLPSDWHDPDPLPSDWHDPDPAVPRAARRRRRCRPRRRRPCPPGCQRPCCRPRRPRRRFPMRHSGRVVVRLAAHLDLRRVDDIENLRAAARELELHGLRRVLRQFGVSAGMTGRLIDVVDRGRECEEDGAGQEYEARRRPTTYELEQRARGTSLPPLHPLSSYWRIDARTLHVDTEAEPGEVRVNGWEPTFDVQVRKLVRQLNALPEVDLAYRELEATDPSPGEPYLGVQEYLDRAPIGIDARWVWRHTPDGARDVGFLDVEQGWLRYADAARSEIAHEDFELDVQGALIFGDNRHGVGDYRGHHGAAVLSEVIGRHGNDKGLAGISKRAGTVLLASHWSNAQQAFGNVANAIRHAIDRLEAGDVLLLEVQRSYLPTEVDEADRDAIRLAVANGIIVIESAGNGNADLDRYVDETGQRVLSRRHPEFRESGALMVGAARAARPHDRLWGRVGVGSNFGSRVDCFAQGDRVVTAGYGDMNHYLEDPAAPEEEVAERSYSAFFGGTSGAAPIIAGAAMLVQGIRDRVVGTRLSPLEMRRILADPRTGTPQGRGVRGRIGVMPDLRRILRHRLGLVSDPFIRDQVGDDGAVPVVGRTDCSPDILVLPQGEGPPAVDDGAGLPALAAGDDYSVFVRLRNRGRQPADPADVKLYWSPAATLVTPDLWNEIPAGAVAVADEPVWAGAFPWQAPAEGRCSFIATVQDRRDEEERGLSLPPRRWPDFSWRRHLSFLRSHANVACCNVHRVPADTEVELEFLLTGTPDRARTFSFELLRGLSAPVSLQLEAQAALAAEIARGRLWRTPPSAGRPEQVMLLPPEQPRVLIEPVRLVAGARLRCAFHVGAGARAGDSLALRQLYRGREVGRITWRFD